MVPIFEFLKTNRRILATAGICLFLCAGFVELSEFLWVSGQMFGDNIPLELMVLALLLLIPLSLFYAIFHVIHLTLTGASRNLQMGSVLLSYVAVIVVFSGFFYFQCSIADLNESTAEYRYYEKLRTPAMQDSMKMYGEALRRRASVRAFQGISPAMWRGIGDKVAGWPDDAGSPPIEKLMEASRTPLTEVISFNHEAKVPVFLDCLYFSAVTITSTGFGDFTPLGRFSKILVVIESVSGVLLVAIGIAIALGGLGSGTSSAAGMPNEDEGEESR
ncbi:MAG: potassium channel family protein [Chlorobium sp.]|uniref:potassium channel family protein n=1 Tax=Chlorobium sp. TaxID=1095 RepID=UPI0025C09AC5|nr:potassium channel family protein [Chlorobium sp.]MCF8383811.1 potassium channel family protein [Chlorobium sp.]